MFACVFAADVRQARIDMPFGCVARALRCGLVIQRPGDRPPAPCPREIESVEMRNLAVAAVAYACGREERFGFALTDAGQEGAEPSAKVVLCEKPAHAFSLDQRWRQKVVL